MKAATVALNVAVSTIAGMALNFVITKFNEWRTAIETNAQKSKELSSSMTDLISQYKELGDKSGWDTDDFAQAKDLNAEILDLLKNQSAEMDKKLRKLDLENGKYQEQIDLLNELSISTMTQNKADQGKLLEQTAKGKSSGQYVIGDSSDTDMANALGGKFGGSLDSNTGVFNFGGFDPNDADSILAYYDKLSKTTSYYRRPISTLWTYIKSKADSVYQPKGSYAASSHTHDDRYYTETEINTKLNGKANSSHTHTKSQITDFPTSLKNPTALTIQTNGAIAATYDGSAAKTVNITKSNIGLGNVDNTADANKSVKYATSAGSASTATKATTSGTADKANSVDWSKVQNKPSSYPPSSHSHAYLPLGGGTISGQIKRDVGCSWIYDRDNAIVYGTSSGTSTGYHPVIGQKTPSGAWTIGTYSDERLIFDYTTDANKTAGTNNGTQVYLPAQAGTIITSATIGSQSVNYANSAGNATNAANATTATKLSSNAGSSVQPVYFSGGKPVAIGYTISSSVPANAKFTDTTYGVASSSSNGLMSSTDKTKLDDFSRVINIQKQIKLTTDWLDTGIAGNSLDTGTYVVQVSGFNSSHTQLYSEIYSGVMSWYSGTTNSGNSSEIFLHNAGLADNNNAIYLRTLRVAGSKTLKLQIACKVAATGTDTLTFKFRRLI